MKKSSKKTTKKTPAKSAAKDKGMVPDVPNPLAKPVEVYKRLQDWAALDGVKIVEPNGFDKDDPELWNHEYTEKAYREGVKESKTEPLVADDGPAAAETAKTAAAASPVVEADIHPAAGEAVAATTTSEPVTATTVPPAPVAESVRTSKPRPDPAVIDPDTWVQIHKAREFEKSCEDRVTSKKAELKAANDKLTDASKRVRELLDNAILSEPSLRQEYELAAKVKAVADKPTCLPPTVGKPSTDAAPGKEPAIKPEAWRNINVDDLGLAPSTTRALHTAFGDGNAGSVATIGHLADWTANHDLTEIDSIGDIGADEIDTKLRAFWSKLGIEPPLAGQPAIPTELAQDATVKAMENLGRVTRERFEWIGVTQEMFDSETGLKMSNDVLTRVLWGDPRAADLNALWADPKLTAGEIEGWAKAIEAMADPYLVEIASRHGITLKPSGTGKAATPQDSVADDTPADAAPPADDGSQIDDDQADDGEGDEFEDDETEDVIDADE